MLRNWFEHHPRQAGCFFLLLAGLNAACGYKIFWQYPCLATANLAEGVLLVIGVITTWPEKIPEVRKAITLPDYGKPDRLLSALGDEDKNEGKDRFEPRLDNVQEN